MSNSGPVRGRCPTPNSVLRTVKSWLLSARFPWSAAQRRGLFEIRLQLALRLAQLLAQLVLLVAQLVDPAVERLEGDLLGRVVRAHPAVGNERLHLRLV